MNILARYIIFAIISIVVNIVCQDVFVRLYVGKFSVLFSVFIGTGAGLLVKYILDKKYTFQYKISDLSHDSKTFALYSAMGIVTTMIFWMTEFSFDYLFETKLMRYVGGIIGLTLGYYIKYQLDKNYVFKVNEN